MSGPDDNTVTDLDPLLEKSLYTELTDAERAIVEAALAKSPQRRADLESRKLELQIMRATQDRAVESHDWQQSEAALHNLLAERNWRLRNAALGIGFWIVAGLLAALIFRQPRVLEMAATFAASLALLLTFWHFRNREERNLLRRGILADEDKAAAVQAHLARTRQRHRWFLIIVFVLFVLAGPWTMVMSFNPGSVRFYADVFSVPELVARWVLFAGGLILVVLTPRVYTQFLSRAARERYDAFLRGEISYEQLWRLRSKR